MTSRTATGHYRPGVPISAIRRVTGMWKRPCFRHTVTIICYFLPYYFFPQMTHLGGGGAGIVTWNISKSFLTLKRKLPWGGTVSLIICGLHICKVVYSLKLIYNAQINSRGAFPVMSRHEQRGENLGSSDTHGPSRGPTRRHSASFHSHCEQVSFSVSISCNTFLLCVGDFTV